MADNGQANEERQADHKLVGPKKYAEFVVTVARAPSIQLIEESDIEILGIN